MKKLRKLLFVMTILVSIVVEMSSCKTSRLENKANKKTERAEFKANGKLAKEYAIKYKHQTKMQGEQQQKMIKKGRKKPINMKSTSKRFFLFRWLGIKKSSPSC